MNVSKNSIGVLTQSQRVDSNKKVTVERVECGVGMKNDRPRKILQTVQTTKNTFSLKTS